MPKNATKSYDKDGNLVGYIFRNVFDKIEYELKKSKRDGKRSSNSRK